MPVRTSRNYKARRFPVPQIVWRDGMLKNKNKNTKTNNNMKHIIASMAIMALAGASLVAQTNSIAQQADGTIILPASKAALHKASSDSQLVYETHDNGDNIGFWTDANDTVSWSIKVSSPGKFKITTEFAQPYDIVNKFALVVDGKQVQCTASPSGSWWDFKSEDSADTLELSAGEIIVTAKPIEEAWRGINLRKIVLTPKK